ncbi:ABC transporter ATP-binding protein [Candidatus Sumerlaeota bacterium]|nr:ABC transporter ATP-binding protein [Candidatus Sumerlaeota bacterium]
MIEINDLGKRYEANWGMRHLNLRVKPGELMACIGPNGAGKTTTIKMLTGLLRPTEGWAKIKGIDIQLDPIRAKRNIGYIPDRPYLYEKLSGRDFMKFVADLFEVDKPRLDAAVEKYFEMFNLTHAVDQLIENYSHGMRQKLIFAATWMHDPEVLIIDEPLVGLDPRSIRLVKNMFREAVKEGKSIFLSTHTLSVAEELADRIAVVHNGTMIFLGTLSELRAQQKGGSGNLEDLFLQITQEETETSDEARVIDVI